MRANRDVTSPDRVDRRGCDVHHRRRLDDARTKPEANALLNQLELQRAMLPPEDRSSVDHDLRVIDDAIAEVKERDRARSEQSGAAAAARLVVSTEGRAPEARQRGELI